MGESRGKTSLPLERAGVAGNADLEGRRSDRERHDHPSSRLALKRHSSTVTPLPCVENERDRAVIDEFDDHVLLKSTCFDLDPLPLHFGNESAVELDRPFGPCSLDKARAPALAAIPQQRELANDEHAAADIEHRAVHFGLVVWKDAETDDLSRQENDVVLRVPFGDSQ